MTNQLVVDFLLSSTSPEILSAYERLAALKFPIPDRRSLTQQLEGEKGGATSVADELLRLALGPSDFPIETPQSALEKFQARVPSVFDTPRFRPVLIPRWEPIPGNQWERPSVAEVYGRTFSPRCAAEALEAYVRAIRNGFREPAAIIIGHMAGQRCEG